MLLRQKRAVHRVEECLELLLNKPRLVFSAHCQSRRVILIQDKAADTFFEYLHVIRILPSQHMQLILQGEGGSIGHGL